MYRRNDLIKTQREFHFFLKKEKIDGEENETMNYFATLVIYNENDRLEDS